MPLDPQNLFHISHFLAVPNRHFFSADCESQNLKSSFLVDLPVSSSQIRHLRPFPDLGGDLRGPREGSELEKGKGRAPLT